MKTLKEAVRALRDEDFIWTVPSASEHGTKYEVSYSQSKDEWYCTCPALKECKHIKLIRDYYVT